MKIVAFENVNFSYRKGTPRERKVLDNVSFQVSAGEVVSFFGRNGSGKTTLLLLCAGVLKPDRGKIEISPGAVVSLALQLPEQSFFAETAFEEIGFGPRRCGKSKKEVEEAVGLAAESVRFPLDRVELSPFSLSGGERRKVALASCLSVHPDVLLLDEPAAGLDWEGRKNLAHLIARLGDRGMAVILATHDPGLSSVTRTAVILEGGRIWPWSRDAHFHRKP
ncbi:MAG: ATP-binding cassette domain-containing protein [Candidatus Eisenbacteria bacterium]|nr:ATP-binding cassette domain-containing protein [Candidatus Eisenbacteria bacterium]